MNIKSIFIEISWAVVAFLLFFAILGSSQIRGAIVYGHEQKDIDPVITSGFALFMTMCFILFKAQYQRVIKEIKEVHL